MSSDAAYIYCLRDPRTDQIRYVGKTTMPDTRRRRHVTETGSGPRYEWTAELRETGLHPTLEILEETTKEDWPGRERYWILALQLVGAPLLNLYPGGHGASGVSPSLETRSKIAKSVRRSWITHPRGISERHRDRLMTGRRRRGWDSAVEAMTKANTGRSMPDHVKDAIREGWQCMPSHAHSPETRRKIGDALSGEGNGMSKLTWFQVREIRYRYAAGGISLSQLGREYGIDTKQIHRIVRNKAWVEHQPQQL